MKYAFVSTYKHIYRVIRRRFASIAFFATALIRDLIFFSCLYKCHVKVLRNLSIYTNQNFIETMRIVMIIYS